MSNTKKLWLVIYWRSRGSRGVINTRQLQLITKQAKFWLRTSRFSGLTRFSWNCWSGDENEMEEQHWLPSDTQTATKYYEVSWLGSALGTVQRWCWTDKTTRQFNCLCLQVNKAGFRLQREAESHYFPPPPSFCRTLWWKYICFSFRICGRFLLFNLKLLRSETKMDLERRLSSKHLTCIPVRQRRSDSDFPNVLW